MNKLIEICVICALFISLAACGPNNTVVASMDDEESVSEAASSLEQPTLFEALPGLENNAYDALNIAGKDLNETEQRLVWSWQSGDPSVGAGYAAVYFFMADKTYIYTGNQMVGADRLRFHEGIWEIRGNQLTIYVTKRVIIEGSVVIDGWGSMINDIEGGELVAYSVDPPETIVVPIDMLFSQSTENQEVILIEDEPYYRFNISPYYLDDYEDFRIGDFSSPELSSSESSHQSIRLDYDTFILAENWEPPYPIALCTGWHASPVVGAGYSDRYLFLADGTFYYSANQMTALREQYKDGEWYYDNGKLYLTVMRKIVIEGGRVVAYGSGEYFEGGEVLKIELPNGQIEHLEYSVKPEEPTPDDVYLKISFGNSFLWNNAKADQDELLTMWDNP